MATTKTQKYIEGIGVHDIMRWEERLTGYALRRMRELGGITIYGTEQKGIISFTIDGAHPHDMASLLDSHNVAVRGGHHCTMPLMDKMGVNGTCRVSFYFYNTLQDIDRFIEGLVQIRETFSR